MGTAKKFGKQGFNVCMIARNAKKLEQLKQELAKENIEADYRAVNATDLGALEEAVRGFLSKDDIDVMHYNVADMRKSPILQESVDSLVRGFKLSVAHGLAVSQLLIPSMTKRGKGTLLFTGGGFSIYPHPEFGSLSLGKAGVRNLAGSLYKALKDQGIKVGTVVIRGTVNGGEARYTPDAIAGEFWKLHTGEVEGPEILY